MQKIVDCKLVINRIVDGIKDCVIEEGKGYHKNDNNSIVVFFSTAMNKYKYIFSNEELIVICNDSEYVFKKGTRREGKIKNGEYVIIFTTETSKIDVKDNSIILNYSLYQQENLIGTYCSELSFN